MRLIAAAFATISLVVALTAVSITSADTQITNPSFEDGLTGWTVFTLGGAAVTTVSDCGAPCAGSPFAPYTPEDGSSYALLSGPPEFPGIAELRQAFTAQAGVVISGSAFLVPAFGPCIADINVTVDSVFFETVFSSPCFGTGTDWSTWSFTVPGAACEDVQVEILVFLFSDAFIEEQAAQMGIDAIEVDQTACVTPTVVASPNATQVPAAPEPTATQRPSSGGGAGGLSGFVSPSQRTAVPGPQSDVAGVQVVGPISPPNTGDAGLAEARR